MSVVLLEISADLMRTAPLSFLLSLTLAFGLSAAMSRAFRLPATRRLLPAGLDVLDALISRLSARSPDFGAALSDDIHQQAFRYAGQAYADVANSTPSRALSTIVRTASYAGGNCRPG